MKIALAQIKSIPGNLKANLDHHLETLVFARSLEVDFVLFPELSLTAYEPAMAKNLAMVPYDPFLDTFQKFCDKYQISTGIGLPTKTKNGVCISSIIFQPRQGRQVYSKKFLHEDETLYFVPGDGNPFLRVQGIPLALAICYEITAEKHAQMAFQQNIQVYLASVAKNKSGIKRAKGRLAQLAEKYTVPTMLCNAVGPMEDGPGYGGSGIWGKGGVLLGSLDHKQEGILIGDQGATLQAAAFKIPQ
jgi:predicted amidohydrolase